MTIFHPYFSTTSPLISKLRTLPKTSVTRTRTPHATSLTVPPAGREKFLCTILVCPVPRQQKCLNNRTILGRNIRTNCQHLQEKANSVYGRQTVTRYLPPQYRATRRWRGSVPIALDMIISVPRMPPCSSIAGQQIPWLSKSIPRPGV